MIWPDMPDAVNSVTRKAWHSFADCSLMTKFEVKDRDFQVFLERMETEPEPTVAAFYHRKKRYKTQL